MKYILLKRSYSSRKGKYITFSRSWSLEMKSNQRIQGIEFATKQKLDTEVEMAVEEIGNISDEEGRFTQEFRNQLRKICAEEFAKFLNKPNLANIKRLIKNVLNKCAKKGLNNKIVQNKLFRTRLAMKILNAEVIK